MFHFHYLMMAFIWINVDGICQYFNVYITHILCISKYIYVYIYSTIMMINYKQNEAMQQAMQSMAFFPWKFNHI